MDQAAMSAKPPGTPRRKGFFLKQANMRRVVYSLIPVALSGVYFFGWRVGAVLAVCFAAGIAAEYVTARLRSAPVSTACLVTCMLYALSLPPTVPLWIAAVGVVVGIVFGKEVFGGFARNFANPALVGRAFVYICFPRQITAGFVPAFKDFPGGLARWSFDVGDLPEYLRETGATFTEAVTQASPMMINKTLGPEVSAKAVAWWELFVGYIGGTFQAPGRAPEMLAAGSIGEGCAVLILAAAVYLLWTRTANWRLMLGTLVGLAVATVLFRNVCGFDAIERAGAFPFIIPPLHFTLAAGTTLYVLVFMVTDPISAPKKKLAQHAYAFLIGFFIVLLRWRGIFVAAATFSVLLGNLIGPLLDIAAGALEQRKKARLAAAAGEGAA